MKATACLTQEHRTILRMLDVLDVMSDWMEQNENVDPSDVEKLLEILDWYGDRCHQRKEETILFPAMQASGAWSEQALNHMVIEHRQEREDIEKLTEDLRSALSSSFIRSAGDLSARLRNHIYKEEQIMFDAADSRFGLEEDAALLRSFEAFDMAAGKEAQAEMLHNLVALERKYLSR